jgi:hypothetical protein
MAAKIKSKINKLEKAFRLLNPGELISPLTQVLVLASKKGSISKFLYADGRLERALSGLYSEIE